MSIRARVKLNNKLSQQFQEKPEGSGFVFNYFHWTAVVAQNILNQLQQLSKYISRYLNLLRLCP